MNAAFIERFVTYTCGGDACVGVLSLPSPGSEFASVGVVVVVGGPQYRVGSHRQFVTLARACAGARLPALRFDYRGMGDSEGTSRTFEAIDDDLRCAIDALCDETGVRRVVLWGLCDAATAGLAYAPGDPRVVGVAMANPWVRTPALEATVRLKSYYLQRLASGAFWSKVARGRLALRSSLADAASAVRTGLAAEVASPTFLERFDRAWSTYDGHLLFLLSGRDYTAAEFDLWVAGDARRGARLRQSTCTVVRLPGADHTFSGRATAQEAWARTVDWMGSFACR